MYEYKTRIKKFLAFLLIAGISAGFSYLLVYKASFLPNGYEIIGVQKDSVTLQSFNWLGMEKDITTIFFYEEDAWKADALFNEVDSQKEFLLLLYTAVSISTILLFYKLINGMKLWKAVFDSNIIFTVGVLLYTIATSWNVLEELAALSALVSCHYFI